MLIKTAVFGMAFLAVFLTVKAFETNDRCFRCHDNPALQLIDSTLNRIKSYSVDRDSFLKSNHKNLLCTNCHIGDFSKWGHGEIIFNPKNCRDCHSNNSIFTKYNPESKSKIRNLNFDTLNNEFKNSVHAVKFGEKFSCFACHNPHEFDRNSKTVKEKIKSDNGMCLNCHGKDEAPLNISTENMPPLKLVHSWLPNPELHWSGVRCVDCHTKSDKSSFSHTILPKEQAVKMCEKCHSQNSVLMSKLYKYTHKESRDKLGFVNGSLLNNAYVIGTTRNKNLDILSVVFFALTFIGIGTHGFLRLKSKKKNKISN